MVLPTLASRVRIIPGEKGSVCHGWETIEEAATSRGVGSDGLAFPSWVRSGRGASSAVTASATILTSAAIPTGRSNAGEY
jgi:hypothetical protein